jgi:hypothetical protein
MVTTWLLSVWLCSEVGRWGECRPVAEERPYPTRAACFTAENEALLDDHIRAHCHIRPEDRKSARR